MYRVILLLSLQILTCYSLRFMVATGEQKCLKEEIHKNVVLTGEYEISEAIGTTASVHVCLNEFGDFFSIYKWAQKSCPRMQKVLA